jgi:hypothetical protein
LRNRPPSAIAIMTRISSSRGASATETVIVSKCGKDQESSLCPSGTFEQSTRRRHLYIRSDHRLSTADRRPHRLPEHRVNAGTAMLHFARNADDRTFAIGDSGSVEQLHQLWHEPLAKHCTGLGKRSQILDKLTGERVADHRHSHSPRDWPIYLNAEFREHGFTEGYDLTDLDPLLPLKARRPK